MPYYVSINNRPPLSVLIGEDDSFYTPRLRYITATIHIISFRSCFYNHLVISIVIMLV